MKRVLLGMGTVILVAAAVAWSGPKSARPEFDFKSEKRNPVTHLRLNNDPADFQFAIVTDRTGGHRARVFSKAVDQLNLLQPEFVVSVGDLIEGYTESKDQLAREWREFQTYTSRLQMPFFYVPGNHDISNKVMEDLWKQKFGRGYYDFVYRDVLFLAVNSEDPPKSDPGGISADQLAWLKKALDANKGVRWTFVFLHKPLWIMNKVEKTGWLDVEKLLAGRNYTVFAGHVHRYQKFVRQGMNYYMLATTGGGSRMRGVEYGEFDHITWVTMKKDSPVIANILLDGILREDLVPIASDEEGVKEYHRRPTYPVEVKVFMDGRPAVGAYVVFHGIGKEPRQPRADGTVEADGTLRLSTYAAFDGVPAGDYAVTAELRKPFYTPEGKRGPNLYPAQYADVKTTLLKAVIKAGEKATLTFDLSSK
jgi:hypothetical protein